MSKLYEVWVTWSMGTTVYVEADNELEAIEIASDEVNIDEDGEYVDDSVDGVVIHV